MAHDSEAVFQQAVSTLRNVLLLRKGRDAGFDRMTDSKQPVLARFQKLFRRDSLEALTEEEFRAFLIFENNTHWSNLQRQGSVICRDMSILRNALLVLQDENLPVGQRLDKAVTLVRGMGKAIGTAVFHVLYPQDVGVWNTVSEAGLKQVSLWPDWHRGESLGTQFEKVNGVLADLAKAADTDLWTLDAIWWFMGHSEEDGGLEDATVDSVEPSLHVFGLERHLHEFLRDNWAHTDLARVGWNLYRGPNNDDDEAGYEHPCDVGRIDLLAKHSDGNRWLVIELKKEQSCDKTIGQVARYMGWVKRELAIGEETVRGLIISHESDLRLRYALEVIPDVDLSLYEVDFRLKKPPALK